MDNKNDLFSVIAVFIFLSLVLVCTNIFLMPTLESPIVYKQENDTSEVDFPIDINKATAWQIEQINGIGEKTAQTIIEYRDKVGRIDSIETLVNINGIGENTVKNLKNFLYV